MLSVVMGLALAGAPMVEVAPYSGKRLADGTLELSYDFAAVRAGKFPDAVATHGEGAVKEFLKKLPKSTKLIVSGGTGWELTAGRGVETGRLSTSFSGVPDGPISVDNPLLRRGAKLRPALDPHEPHVLLSADALAWQVRQVELSALAAEEVDSEALRRELWNRVLDKALSRSRATQGDAREGALTLAARIAAATGCLEASKAAALVGGHDDVMLAVSAELSRLSESPDAVVAPVPFSWRPELRCAWVRLRALSQPFERSRGGTAAVLTFLDFLEQDAHLNGLWQRIRARRDRFLGAPAGEPIALWKEKAKGEPAEAIENLSRFIDELPQDERVPPGLVPAPVTPFGRFASQLEGAERAAVWPELVTSAAEGRLSPGNTTWPDARDAAMVALAKVDQVPSVHFDGDWRDRLQGTFHALVGGVSDRPEPGAPEEKAEVERSELEVRLIVPPMLDVEPVPELYSRLATSLDRLAKAMEAEQLTGLAGLTSDGQKQGKIYDTVQVWMNRCTGLAALAQPETGANRHLAEARALVRDWRVEPAFSKDVREALVTPISLPSERQHSALVGVSRRELLVSFAAEPQISVAPGFSKEGLTFHPSEQRYLVPVLVSVVGTAPPRNEPMELKRLKALIDDAGRDAHQVEGVFAETLKQDAEAYGPH